MRFMFRKIRGGGMGGKPLKDMAVVAEDLRLDMIRAHVSKKQGFGRGATPSFANH